MPGRDRLAGRAPLFAPHSLPRPAAPRGLALRSGRGRGSGYALLFCLPADQPESAGAGRVGDAGSVRRPARAGRGGAGSVGRPARAGRGGAGSVGRSARAGWGDAGSVRRPARAGRGGAGSVGRPARAGRGGAGCWRVPRPDVAALAGGAGRRAAALPPLAAHGLASGHRSAGSPLARRPATPGRAAGKLERPDSGAGGQPGAVLAPAAAGAGPRHPGHPRRAPFPHSPFPIRHSPINHSPRRRPRPAAPHPPGLPLDAALPCALSLHLLAALERAAGHGTGRAVALEHAPEPRPGLDQPHPVGGRLGRRPALLLERPRPRGRRSPRGRAPTGPALAARRRDSGQRRLRLHRAADLLAGAGGLAWPADRLHASRRRTDSQRTGRGDPADRPHRWRGRPGLGRCKLGLLRPAGRCHAPRPGQPCGPDRSPVALPHLRHGQRSPGRNPRRAGGGLDPLRRPGLQRGGQPAGAGLAGDAPGVVVRAGAGGRNVRRLAGAAPAVGRRALAGRGRRCAGPARRALAARPGPARPAGGALAASGGCRGRGLGGRRRAAGGQYARPDHGQRAGAAAAPGHSPRHSARPL